MIHRYLTCNIYSEPYLTITLTISTSPRVSTRTKRRDASHVRSRRRGRVTRAMARANRALTPPGPPPRPLAPHHVVSETKKSQDGCCVMPSLYASDWHANSVTGDVGAVLAMYGVFDGHKDNTAMEYLERHWPRHAEHETKMLAARGGGAKTGENGLEGAFRRALKRCEDDYGRSNMGSCFFCHGPTPEGGSTVNVVTLQRVTPSAGDGRQLAIDIVCGNVGDSGALMLPHPSEFEGIEPDQRTMHVRLSREHNPDDPFEARRLVSSECRLARLRGQRGEEVGPLRVFPGGYAISRAFGDFDAPGIVCEPEFTRVRVPAVGCRLLIASDGVFSALKDSEVAEECLNWLEPASCARGVVDKVLRVRGKHDDITCIVVDIPSLDVLESILRETTESYAGPVDVQTLWQKPKSALTREQMLEIEAAVSEIPDDIDVTVHRGRNFGDFAAKKLYEDFDVQDLIGRGVYGSVRRAQNRKTGEIVAVKSILRTRVDEAAIRDECDILQVLCGHHPNFPQHLIVYEDSGLLKGEVTHIVMDLYTGGSLLQAIEKRGMFDEGDWCVLANELLGAVSFMHSLGVAHRDLKPDNIMLVAPWSPEPGSIPIIKLIDFGSATFCLAHETLKGHVGTKFFSAPETLKRKPYTKKCDVWSVGVILLVLLKGFPNGTAVEGQWRALQQGLKPTFPESVPKHFVKLINACLVMDQTRRPSCGSILKAAGDWLGTSFASNAVLTSPTKARPARRLAVPRNFAEAFSNYGKMAHDSISSRDAVVNHEEEDISVHKDNSWQLDLTMDRDARAGPLKQLEVLDNLAAHNACSAYQKHVTDMLSVVATPVEIRDILLYLETARKDTQEERKSSFDGIEHANWCSAKSLEDAARESGAADSLTQLELARHLTGLDGQDLWIELTALKNLDTLHKRHQHVFNAFASERSKEASGATSPMKLDALELSAVDDDREAVQSDAHADMVRAMLARGLSSYNLSSMAKTPSEPSELTVRGGSAWFWEDWSNSGSASVAEAH